MKGVAEAYPESMVHKTTEGPVGGPYTIFLKILIEIDLILIIASVWLFTFHGERSITGKFSYFLMMQHDWSLLDCALSFISHMNVLTLSGVPDVFRRVADHFSFWTEMDVDDNTRAMCEDVWESCRVVLQELNRILDENEQDEPEDSSGSDSDGSPFLFT